MATFADWQVELRGLTLGELTSYHLTGPVSGLGVPGVRSNDLELLNRHGDVGGVDVLQRRSIMVPVGVDGDSLADTQTKLQALKAAWRPSSSELGFDVRLPGQAIAVFRYYGRPRGAEADLTRLRSSWADVMCSFEALDPLAYAPEASSTISASTGGILNAGDIETDRIVLIITGNGGTPVVTNTTAGGAVAFIGALGSGVTRTLDVRARTVVDSGGVSKYAEIVPASAWFTLAPGNNILSLAGAASVAVAWRSAWV